MRKRLVFWSRGAENELTRLYTDHRQLRNTIASKSSAIEHHLEDDAERFADESRTEEKDYAGQFGIESRTVVRAIGFELPLGVEFVIEDSIIIVVRVWLVRRRGQSLD